MESIKRVFSNEWYKGIVIGSIPVFLTFILMALYNLSGSTSAMETSIKNQKEILDRHQVSFEKYASKIDERIVKNTEAIKLNSENIVDHEYRLKDIEKRVN